MSLAFCAPQSSRFSLSFALRKLLLENFWELILSEDKYFHQSAFNTFQRNTQVKDRKGDSTGSLF